jgi:hypothetical protein
MNLRGPRAGLLVVLTALAPLFTTLLLAEAYFYFFSPQEMQHDEMFQKDKTLGWKFIPNKRSGIVYGEEARHYIKINPQGFRGAPFTPKTEGRYDVAVLGDSFTSNLAVRRMDLFTRKMRERFGLERSAVMNFGINGFGQTQEYLLLQEILKQYDPDLLIVMIYLGNDLSDNVAATITYVGATQIPYAKLNADKNDVSIHYQKFGRDRVQKEHFLSRFQSYHFIKSRLTRLAQAPPGFGWDELAPFRVPLSQKTSEGYLIQKLLMRKIASLAKAKNIPCLFVAAPFYFQIHEDDLKAAAASERLNLKRYDFLQPNRLLRQSAEEEGFWLLDLTPRLKAETQSGKRLYHRLEQHWTPEGNKIVADEIIKELLAKNILPETIRASASAANQ